MTNKVAMSYMNSLLTRRSLLKTAAISATGLFASRLFTPAWADDKSQIAPTEAEAATLDKIGREFIARFNSPGLSVAIARQKRFLFCQTWGLATPDEELTSSHLFRIASVTKPLTSVAIFQFIENGDLKLTDRVFGADGVLEYDFGRSYPAVVDDITIHHLLTHTCGGWSNRQRDPMFQNPQWGHEELIVHTLQTQPLEYPPGEQYAYSNFGYCLLGRVIEKLSGQTYDQYVRDNMLSACGITDMQIAGNTIAERAAGEVMYLGQNGEDAYNMNISRMDSHGGWLGTPTDVVNFALHVDGFNQTPDLLSPRLLKSMTTASTANAKYACGWEINMVPNWWHTGSLPGTSTLLVRTASGLCWAAFANTRTKDIGLALDQMMWEMATTVSSWHA